MAIQGSLKDMALTEIIQLNCQGGNTSRVSLVNGEQKGNIYFANGQIIHASHAKDNGEEAIYQLLRWTDGNFTIEKGIASPQQSINTPWHALLLQGVQQLDEANAATNATNTTNANHSNYSNHNETTTQPRKEAASDSTDPQVLPPEITGIRNFVAAQIISADGYFVSGHAQSQNVNGDAQNQDVDSKRAFAVQFHLANQTKAILENLDAGLFQETITFTQTHCFITRPLNQGQYYICLILVGNSNLGAVRLHLADQEKNILKNISQLK